MTAHFATTNSIGPGTRFTFTAAGDSYTILPGVTVAATDGVSPLDGTGRDNIAVAVFGTLAGQTAFAGAAPQFVIGPSGSVVASGTILLGAVNFFDSAVNASFANAGFLSALGGIGVLSLAAGFSGTNSGSIVAALPVGIDVTGPGSGGRFVNSGLIEAFVTGGFNYAGNGVLVATASIRIENLAGGRIVGDGPSGAGVKFGTAVGDDAAVTGSVFVNAGEVTSLRWWGVDYGEAAAGTLTLQNSGVIRGEAGAFRGHAGIDLVTNSGRMEGNADLGGGNDVFLASGGTVLGDVLLGLGNDRYDGRGASFVSGTVLGGGGNDTLTGGAGDDRLSGGNQNDSLQGGAGEDTLSGDAGNDTIHGGKDDDVIAGGAGDDRLTGGAGDDTLEGGAGNDTIFGGAGDDTITGGAGADLMAGGPGADVFVFATVAEIGLAAGSRDRITDFRRGEDVIDLSAIDANTWVAGDQAFTFIAGAFTGVAGQLRYDGANGLVQGDVNGDGVADFSLQLAPGLGLTAADFVL